MSRLEQKISIIIHFLNSAQYLAQALESVSRQTFTDWELVLVDGGSSDDSVAICKVFQKKFPDRIRILEHKGTNTLGIFSSRIWGAREAQCPILALLDSDDEWHPQFLEQQYAIYQATLSTSPGMVYCPVIYWWDDPSLVTKSYVQPSPAPGLHQPPELLLEFLENKYHKSAANSSVMVARHIILEAASLIGIADEGMVEDQFLWSFLLLHYPVFVNPEPLVRYRQWTGSTCAVTGAKGEAKQIRKYHLEWLLSYLSENYNGVVYDMLRKQVEQLIQLEYSTEDAPVSPLSRVLTRQPLQPVKKPLSSLLQRLLPNNAYLFLQKLYRRIRFRIGGLIKRDRNKGRSIRKIYTKIRLFWGTEPVSFQWGDDRGLSIYRYYIWKFIEKYATDIQGHCLEFQDNRLTQRFGGQRVTKSDILHQDSTNPKATLIADLTQPNDLPDDTFDCIICTHVFHVIFDLEKAVADLYRILKPGGVLLAAVPLVSMCDPQYHELWRFTPEGLYRVLTRTFSPEDVMIQAYGNSLTSAGVIRGVASHEISRAELDYHDPRFAAEVCARAVKTNKNSVKKQ